VSLCAERHAPLAMHLAESREELDWLRTGGGPFAEFLGRLEGFDPSAFLPGRRPLDYLRLLAKAPRTLVIHGNYLDDEEIALLGARAARMTVVYCPRTHDWFAHDEYPLEKMLAAGVAVALGTDGRGSSPDLSLLAEMRFAARRHPAVGLDRILQMGTIVGARFLGWELHVGSLEPGKQADLAIVALPDRDAADPHELILKSEGPVAACYCRGEKITAGVP
jgi:aminodeoxyfutalosine deaminase